MPLYTKPEFNTVWASEGTRLAPTPAKTRQGWIVEIPPFEQENWIQNRQDQMLAHINQRGIPAWDVTAEYYANTSYVTGPTNGLVYRAVSSSTGINPESANTAWVQAFPSNADVLFKTQNLADVPNKPLARSNLGIPTTADYDARYLIKNSNLSDIPNKATARGNLDVYSKGEVFTRQEIENLIPAGKIDYFFRTTPPPGWLVCAGQAVSRVTYAKLFAAIGTIAGAGDGSTTFNLPDLRGEFLRGLDSGRGIDPGRSLGTLQQSQNRSHTHQFNMQDVLSDKIIAFGREDAGGIPSDPTGYSQGNNGNDRVVSIVNEGGNESRPRNIAVSICISTGLLA